MKHYFIRRTLATSIVFISISAVVCASAAVSNDEIEKNTAFTLGLSSNSFTIYDRMDNGLKVTYTVKTNAGKQYNCYVTGSGRLVSDALCNEIDKTDTSSGVCNALLKAAGRC